MVRDLGGALGDEGRLRSKRNDIGKFEQPWLHRRPERRLCRVRLRRQTTRSLPPADHRRRRAMGHCVCSRISTTGSGATRFAPAATPRISAIASSGKSKQHPPGTATRGRPRRRWRRESGEPCGDASAVIVLLFVVAVRLCHGAAGHVAAGASRLGEIRRDRGHRHAASGPEFDVGTRMNEARASLPVTTW